MSQKRMEIIKTAAVLIHSKGYENTKLSDILEAAQIGKGQFYHYFSSKRELGLAVIDYFFQRWNRLLIEEILDSRKAPDEKFNEMLEWVVATHRANSAKCGCVFGNLAIEMSEHDELFRQKIKTIFDLWTEKLKPVIAGMIAAPYREDAAVVNQLAQGVVAMLEGGILLMKSRQDIEVLTHMTELIKTLVNSYARPKSEKNC